MTDEPLTPGEARVRELLRPLNAAPPQPGTALVVRVVRTARWQRVVRSGLAAAGHVVGALADGLALLIGRRR
jgi:hypothetical protein